MAEAAQVAGREVEGRRAAEAGAAAQAADEPAMPAAGNVGPGRREAILNPNVGDRVPQEAAPPPARARRPSDTAGGAGGGRRAEAPAAAAEAPARAGGAGR